MDDRNMQFNDCIEAALKELNDACVKNSLRKYAKWYRMYCEDHPEFDGYNDDAIDAFWAAAQEAGFNVATIAEGVDNGL
jgi:imidazolonepropionase-like amidohydrolase